MSQRPCSTSQPSDRGSNPRSATNRFADSHPSETFTVPSRVPSMASTTLSLADKRATSAATANAERRPYRSVLLAGPLGEQVDGFVEVLRSQGYAAASVHVKLLCEAQLSRWLERRRLALGALDEGRRGEFLRGRRRRHRAHRGAGATGVQLLRRSRTTGALPPVEIAARHDEAAVVEARYVKYLCEERGLSDATLLTTCRRSAGRWSSASMRGTYGSRSYGPAT